MSDRTIAAVGQMIERHAELIGCAPDSPDGYLWQVLVSLRQWAKARGVDFEKQAQLAATYTDGV